MERTPRRLLSPSNLITGLMVSAAGAVAWFGLQGSPAVTAPRDGEPVTMAAEPAEDVALAGDAAVRSSVGLPTRLVASSAGIDTAISEVGVVRAEGKSYWETAWRSAGHHVNSARPGQPGNVVITGHVSVADEGNLAVFSTLEQVQPGDVVELYAGDKVYRYAIQSTAVVPPAAVHVLRSNARSRLTLITCTPDLEKRLVVVGELVEGL